ncbi:FAD-dependent oxidoreductase [Candidatus Woesebacteria bacterium]|nr:FAD-dependent oxidoreductase [Candidatus Woesebacteria bacterium]
MKLKLIKKNNEAKGTVSFFFKPEKKVNWLPGQYFYHTLPKLKYPDPKGATRHFTISSSPTEGNTIRLTTRIRDESGFKQTLNGLQVGAEIEGEGPSGTFILDENEPGPHVILAGGIGITPFRAIIKYIIDNRLKIPIYLIYSNSAPEEITFKKEFEGWVKKNSNIKIEFVITRKDGRVDESMINNFLKNWKLQTASCTFWVCGPPPMVDAMEKALGKMSVSLSQVRSEKFTGY